MWVIKKVLLDREPVDDGLRAGKLNRVLHQCEHEGVKQFLWRIVIQGILFVQKSLLSSQLRGQNLEVLLGLLVDFNALLATVDNLDCFLKCFITVGPAILHNILLEFIKLTHVRINVDDSGQTGIAIVVLNGVVKSVSRYDRNLK